MRILAAIVLLIVSNAVQAQSIRGAQLVGIWQADTDLVADAYLDSYQFFDDGRFIFHTDQYDGLQRIVEITGRFSVSRDTLYLIPEATVERMGGSLQRSKTDTRSDSWELYGYVLQTVRPKSPFERQAVHLEESPQAPGRCLLFDERLYYRVDKNPNNYQ